MGCSDCGDKTGDMLPPSKTITGFFPDVPSARSATANFKRLLLLISFMAFCRKELRRMSTSGCGDAHPSGPPVLLQASIHIRFFTPTLTPAKRQTPNKHRSTHTHTHTHTHLDTLIGI